jgi:uncharacterized membrane protein YdjX (TVP38/TMEM64 family)
MHRSLTSPPRRPLRRTAVLLVAAVPIAVVTVAFSLVSGRDFLAIAVGVVRDSGRWGSLAYGGLFLALVMLGAPSTPFLIGSGLLFGLTLGGLVAAAASTGASLISFLVARHLARDWVERRTRRMPRWQAILDVVEERGFEVVLLARLNPLLPTSLTSYGFGVTEVSFPRYAAASALGQVPYAVIYAYLGSISGHALLRRGVHAESVDFRLLGSGLAIGALLAGVLMWYAKRKLDRLSAWKRARAAGPAGDVSERGL